MRVGVSEICGGEGNGMGELGKGNVMDHMCISGNDLSTVV